MLTAILNFLFGCSHGNLSRVFTLRQRATREKRTYKVCLDCGREFEFDWHNLGAIESGDGLRISEAGQVQEN